MYLKTQKRCGSTYCVLFLISDVHVKLLVFKKLIMWVLFATLQNFDCNICDAL